MKLIIITDMLIPQLRKLFVSFVSLVKDLNFKLIVMEVNTVLVSIVLILFLSSIIMKNPN